MTWAEEINQDVTDIQETVTSGKVGLVVTGSQSKYGLTDGQIVLSLVGEKINLAERGVVAVVAKTEHDGPKRCALVQLSVFEEAQISGYAGWEFYDGDCRYVIMRNSPPRPALIFPTAFQRYQTLKMKMFYSFKKDADGNVVFDKYARNNAGHIVFAKAVMELPAGRYMVVKLQESMELDKVMRSNRASYTVIKPRRYNLGNPRERELNEIVRTFPLETSKDTLGHIMDTLQCYTTLNIEELDKDNVLNAPTFDEQYRERILDVKSLEEFLNGN